MHPTTKINLTALARIEVVDEALAAILRTKTPAERVAMTLDAHETARELLTAQVGSKHKDWTTEQINCEVARRLLRETK